ncbi:hypothetical protein [Pedobacter sp. GR22-6]|uniref:hypothetical protein n=1 Tax=Pedobacter sp. GR22-6 TaxID=3127957 RepID=UPI00307F8FC1
MMNGLNKSQLLVDLEVYAAFVSELELDKDTDRQDKVQELMEYTEILLNGLQMRVLVEPFFLLMDMTMLKLTCAELICRLLRLKSEHYSLSLENAKKYQPKVEWTFSVSMMIVQLEELYTFYNSHNIMAGELGGI